MINHFRLHVMIKILSIDDNEDNLLVLNALISDAFPDSKLFNAKSGKEGIMMARAEDPDVILLDLIMPEMNGFETCEALKEDELLKYIPVIILTAARVSSEERIKALLLGAEAFLSKPFDRAELIAQISAMLRLRHSELNVRNENIRLEQLVFERTKDLQKKLDDQKNIEFKLQKSYKQLEISKLATFNLLEDIKVEIEQRKRVEEEILKMNEELELRVKERTNELASAYEELESFAYSVSHDLRAPLRAIDGFSKYVLEDYGDDLNPEGKRFLGMIRTNTQKMDKLITDILALSRVSRGGYKVSKIDMKSMAFSMLNEAASPEILEKITYTAGKLPDAYADPTFLKQVWINLLSNAIKFSSKKRNPKITIRGFIENGYTVYSVTDNGVGFNPEYSHKLYGVFQRLHKTTDFEGTGVGLAIVKRIITRHGGKVWAEGKTGKGATFYFSLPIKKMDITSIPDSDSLT